MNVTTTAAAAAAATTATTAEATTTPTATATESLSINLPVNICAIKTGARPRDARSLNQLAKAIGSFVKATFG